MTAMLDHKDTEQATWPELRFKKKELQYAVKQVAAFTGKNLPDTQMIHVRFYNDGWVQLGAVNVRTVFRKLLPYQGEAFTTPFTLPAADLLAWLNNVSLAKAETISLSQDEYQFNLYADNGEEVAWDKPTYSTFHKAIWDDCDTIYTATMAGVFNPLVLHKLGSIAPCLSKDETRPVLTGFFMEPKEGVGYMATAADSFRMGHTALEGWVNSDRDLLTSAFIAPPELFKAFTRLLPVKESQLETTEEGVTPVILSTRPNSQTLYWQYGAAGEQWEFITHAIEGNYPRYEWIAKPFHEEEKVGLRTTFDKKKVVKALKETLMPVYLEQTKYDNHTLILDFQFSTTRQGGVGLSLLGWTNTGKDEEFGSYHDKQYYQPTTAMFESGALAGIWFDLTDFEVVGKELGEIVDNSNRSFYRIPVNGVYLAECLAGLEGSNVTIHCKSNLANNEPIMLTTEIEGEFMIVMPLQFGWIPLGIVVTEDRHGNR